MNRSVFLVVLASLLTMACGSSGVADQASPLSVVPARAMISIVLDNPAGIIRNIDGYIQDGMPIMGECFIENFVCGQLAILCLDSTTARYGLDPSGQLVFWMESAMPSSMGMAVSAPDFSLFLAAMSEMEVELAVEESLDDIAVYSMNSEEGTMYFAAACGVVIMAMSSTKLEALISDLGPVASDQSTPVSLKMKLNLSMIGPMAAAQMPMARVMMMQGMAADTTMPVFVPVIMDVYMDGIESFLTQADILELVLIAESENVVFRKNVSFVQGSSLAELLVFTQGQDMVQHITQGDVATVRFQIPSEIAYQITKSFTEVFTYDISEEVIHFWASMASNGAVAIYNDDVMHMVAAYEVSPAMTTEKIADMYSDYLNALMPVIEQNTDAGEFFTVHNNGIVQKEGTDFYSISVAVVVDSTTMNFDYWMTVHNGALLLETASAPAILLDIVSGDFIPAEIAGADAMAGEISLAGYINLIMRVSPNGMDIPATDSDVMFIWDGGYSEGEIYSEMIMDGSDAVETGYALFGLISAMK